MFSDKFKLTEAVLDGRKTMTRRLVVSITTSDGAVHHVDKTVGSYHEYMGKDGKVCLAWSPYKVGDVVAIAQSYYTIKESHKDDIPIWANIVANTCDGEPGCYNKMFVKADLMPHHIRITDIKMERLKDISREDCMKEGILNKNSGNHMHKRACPFYFAGGKHIWDNSYSTPRQAFAALIDKVIGKGTWKSNPWVFCYSFELID